MSLEQEHIEESNVKAACMKRERGLTPPKVENSKKKNVKTEPEPGKKEQQQKDE